MSPNEVPLLKELQEYHSTWQEKAVVLVKILSKWSCLKNTLTVPMTPSFLQALE